MSEEIIPRTHKKQFADMTLQELKEEAAYWNQKIAEADSWGAAVAAAHEFKTCCDRRIKLLESTDGK